MFFLFAAILIPFLHFGFLADLVICSVALGLDINISVNNSRKEWAAQEAKQAQEEAMEDLKTELEAIKEELAWQREHSNDVEETAHQYYERVRQEEAARK